MDEMLQDDHLVKCELAELDRMKGERAPWESQWMDIDDRVNPVTGGGFRPQAPGGRRGQGNFDVTAVQGLERFTAAMTGITVPRRSQYIKIRFANEDLDKLPEVRRWCEYAGDRLYAMRYAPMSGFGVAASEDFRQLGTYGTSPVWVEAKAGTGLFYRTLPLSECYIDVDFAGNVDTLRRSFKRTARQCAQLFGGADNLTPKMRDALAQDKGHTEFEILHTVRPNSDYEPDRLDHRGMPVMSLYIAQDEKAILRHKGFHSNPVATSRHVTSAGEKYGRSPAMAVLPTILGANQMAQTILRAGHKAVDPALAFYDDDGITKLVTRPGGLNPGLVNEEGRILVAPIPQGGSLPLGMEMLEQERGVIRTAFLEDFFKLITDETVQRSATAVLEIAGKQGILVAPYAERYEMEKQNPITQRELELALSAGQLARWPEVVDEAGAWPMIYYDNPLSRMARAEEAAGLTRWIEAMTPIANVDPSVFDHIDTDNAAPGLADVLGVRPSWIATPDKVQAKRDARKDQQDAQAAIEQLQGAASAYQDIAKGNQIAEAA